MFFVIFLFLSLKEGNSIARIVIFLVYIRVDRPLTGRVRPHHHPLQSFSEVLGVFSGLPGLPAGGTAIRPVLVTARHIQHNHNFD